eukprot:COSAG06_NODE_3597_length_5138_cov_4.401865_1_plen_737_part_00
MDMLDAMGLAASDDEEEEHALDYNATGDDDDIVAMLMAQIEEKEDQLKMAAEIGRSLLQKNEEMAEQTEELEEDRDRLDAELEEAQWRIDELEENQAQIDGADLAELEGLRAERDELAEQLRASQAEEAKTRETLDAKAAEVEALGAQLRQSLANEEHAAELREVAQQRDGLEAQLEAAHAEREVKAREATDAAARQNRAMEERETQIADLQREASAWAAERVALDDAAAQVREQAETAESHSAQLAMTVSRLQTELATRASQQSLGHAAAGAADEEGVPPAGGDSLGDEIAAMPEAEPEPEQNELVSRLLAEKDAALTALLAEKEQLLTDQRGLQQRLAARESELLAEKEQLLADSRALQQQLSSREADLTAAAAAAATTLKQQQADGAKILQETKAQHEGALNAAKAALAATAAEDLAALKSAHETALATQVGEAARAAAAAADASLKKERDAAAASAAAKEMLVVENRALQQRLAAAAAAATRDSDSTDGGGGPAVTTRTRARSKSGAGADSSPSPPPARITSPVDREARRSARRQSVALVAEELASVVAEDGAASPRDSVSASSASAGTGPSSGGGGKSRGAGSSEARRAARRQSVALEADALAKLQQGLQQAPEQIAAAKSAGEAALKVLSPQQPASGNGAGGGDSGSGSGSSSGGGGGNAAQSEDVITARSDPLWQFFYLTAMAHKLNKPFLGQMPLTTDDIFKLFTKAKANPTMSFEKWPVRKTNQRIF